MHSAVYAVASSAIAGRAVDESLVHAALKELRDDVHKFEDDGELIELIHYLEQILDTDGFEAKRHAILDGMARAFFVDDWARFQEEEGEGIPAGVELLSWAPATSDEAFSHAFDYAQRLKNENEQSLIKLFSEACEADSNAKFNNNQHAREFGHYLAMSAMGHGVSWFDDHARFEINIPHSNYYS